MATIVPKMHYNDNKNGKSFDPMSYNGKDLRCCCGYELIKEDENTYHCTGGSHKYNINEGDIELDKFGNILLKIPENFKANK